MASHLDDVKQALAATAPPDVEESADRVYLFISYDLVDATAFKAISKEWPVVISKFYELSIREIQELSPAFLLWKLAGDEVLMYREVTSLEDLAHDVKNLHMALNKVIDQLYNSFDQTRNLLSAKGTVWLAQASYMPPQKMQDALSAAIQGSSRTGSAVNIRIQFPLDASRNAVDFLGPDVDVGFRIAQFADKRKLVVSANLANVISTYSPRNSIDIATLRIVAFERLKGVWNGRPYPIIWYHDDWGKIGDTFYYDDVGQIIKHVREVGGKDLSELNKVYSDLNRTHEISTIADAIKSAPADKSGSVEISENPAKLAEVHCAAVCFREDGRVLIGRRPSGKRRLKGVFEFGCGQLKPNQSFEECLRESYREDFGVGLKRISKLPINTYVIGGDRRIPGLLFYAELENPQDVESRFLKAKHTEIRWLDPSKLDQIDDSEYVPDFRTTVANALRAREEYGQ